MKPPLHNQTFLITGAAQRIGAALALACARAGANIILHHHRSDPSETLAQLRALGVQAHAIQSPLDSADDALKLFNAAQRILPITGLINNAARFSTSTLANATPNETLALWQTNTLAPLALMQAFAKHRFLSTNDANEREYEKKIKNHSRSFASFVDKNKGLNCSILNLLDQRIAHPAQTPVYTATKSALAQLTLAAAVEFAPKIRVNAIAPGPVLPPPNAHEKAGALLLQSRPTLDDLCNAALYLLTAPAVTGQILYVDSGQHLRNFIT